MNLEGADLNLDPKEVVAAAWHSAGRPQDFQCP